MIMKLRFLIVEDLHFCQTILTFQLPDLNFNILKFVYKLLSHQIKIFARVLQFSFFIIISCWSTTLSLSTKHETKHRSLQLYRKIMNKFSTD